jgi:hypothetical protein
MTCRKKISVLLVFAFMLMINGLNSQDIAKLSSNKALLSYLGRQELDLSAYHWDDNLLNGYIYQIHRKKTSNVIFKSIGVAFLSSGAVIATFGATYQPLKNVEPFGIVNNIIKDAIIVKGLGFMGVSVPFFIVGGNKKQKLKLNLAKAKDRYRELQGR